MDKRPALQRGLDEDTFRSYYYLKEELLAFCRENGLPTSGGKMELTERIAAYLSTGEIRPVQPRAGAKPKVGVIMPETPIEPGFICSEKHRAFFREQIGGGFSFNVPFQKWLKANPGKTYAQAVEAYHEILSEKKNCRSTIDRQFEYNTYIRAFFDENPGKTLKQAIACWNYKKSQPGHNRYEQSDLSALESPQPTAQEDGKTEI